VHVTTETAFLTPEEMAAKLRISIRKLQQMMKAGTGPKHIKLGGRVLFPIGQEARHD
jgi:predicted DNA-binding transcriptional regulator AlpA